MRTVVLRWAVASLLLVTASWAAPMGGGFGGGGYAGLPGGFDLGSLSHLHAPGGFIGRFGGLDHGILSGRGVLRDQGVLHDQGVLRDQAVLLGGVEEPEGFRRVGGPLDTSQWDDATLQNFQAPGAGQQTAGPNDIGLQGGAPDSQGLGLNDGDPQHAGLPASDLPGVVETQQDILLALNELQRAQHNMDETLRRAKVSLEGYEAPHLGQRLGAGGISAIGPEEAPLQEAQQDLGQIGLRLQQNVRPESDLRRDLDIGLHELGLQKVLLDINGPNGHQKVIAINNARNFHRAGIPWANCISSSDPRCRQPVRLPNPWLLF